MYILHPQAQKVVFSLLRLFPLIPLFCSISFSPLSCLLQQFFFQFLCGDRSGQSRTREQTHKRQKNKFLNQRRKLFIAMFVATN
jgi:hypothetical protein